PPSPISITSIKSSPATSRSISGWASESDRRMILGYVDVQDRIYDLNFATLRPPVLIEAGPSAPESRVAFSQVAGEGATSYRVIGEADVTAEAAMDHDGHRIPLLRAVQGHLYRHEAGLLFFASPGKRDLEDP